MYSVPADFHNIITADGVNTRIRIYFVNDSVDYTDDEDVVANGTLLAAPGDSDSNGIIGQSGISINEFFNSGTNVSIGATVSSQVDMTILNNGGLLNNFGFGRCKIYVDAYDSTNSTWLTCPLGVFNIEIPKRRKVQLISAGGYDLMQTLDAIADSWWNGLAWSGGITIAQIIQSMVSTLGLHLSATSIPGLPNGTLSFSASPFTSVEMTYRDILAYIAEATGTIAHFDRDGALDLRWFDQAATVDTETYTDSIVSFVGTSNTSVSSAVVPITPIQDLHGYDNPWPSGGGVSKCPSFANGTHTMTNGLTVTIQDGEITINGTASSSGYYQEGIESTVMPADAYVSFNNPVGTYNIAYVFINGNTQIAAPSTAPANATKKPTGLSGATVNKLRIFCNAGTYNNFKMSPIVHDGSTPQAWQPYANICPISGRSGLNVYVSPTEDIADATAYAEDWTLQAGTVYGGTVDIVSGVLTVDRANIPSYNGETITEPWLSSMDEYTPGATPTTGAQVVYELATPVTYQLTSQQITALVGQNYVWSSVGGAITVETSTVNPVTVDADTLGNNCLEIEVAEYQVAAIDALSVKATGTDVGVTIGSGANAYSIINNPLLGGTEQQITDKATPIYNQIVTFPSFSPIQMRVITDCSIEAGDIINIVYGGTTYSLPIFQQTLLWRGGYVFSEMISSGDTVLPTVSSAQRKDFRTATQLHEFEVTLDTLRSLIQSVDGNYTLIEQTVNAIQQTVSAQGITIQNILDPTGEIWTAITNNSTNLGAVESALNAEITERKSYIRFLPAEPAIVLGVDTGNEIKLKLANDKIWFFNGDDDSTDLSLAFAYFNSQEVYARRFVGGDSVQIGTNDDANHWIWKKLDNGDLVLDVV